jgi:DNA-damage-inducible protein J
MAPVTLKSADVRTRIEPELKKSAETVLAENGLTISDAIRMFLRQVVVYGGLPFDVRISNETTLQALHESRSMKGKARFDSPADLFNELEAKRGKAAPKKRSHEAV